MGKIFKCSDCANRTFKKSGSLRWHYKNYHPTIEIPKLTPINSYNFTCKKCSIEFNYYINLMRHDRIFHSNHAKPFNHKQNKYEVCSSEFENNGNLQKHGRFKHNNYLQLSAVPNKYMCSECSCEYTSKKNLKRHQRLKHNGWVTRKSTKVNCSICSMSLNQKEDLYNHWKLDHAINIESEEVELENKDTFLLWKNSVESSTKFKYIKNISGFSSKSGVTVYYQCNRSGYFISRSNGFRQTKAQGTCKINGICPARMKVRVLATGKHIVQFIKTHVCQGHDLTKYNSLNIHNSNDVIQDSSSESWDSDFKILKCNECDAQYTTNKNLKRHERIKHGKELKKFSIVKCSLCSIFLTQKDLFEHWKLEHAISIETEELKLQNKDMFLSWKRKIESDTKSKFIRSISGFSSRSGETIYYQCNRSGYFNSKSKGLRHITNGSLKINSICPARMKVRILENDRHIITFTKTHVGHTFDSNDSKIANSHLQTLPLVEKEFKCKECTAQYSNMKSLKRHKNLKHKGSFAKKFNLIKCSICSNFVSCKTDLFQHWELEHSINIETEQLELENKEMFLIWKNNIENDTRSKFVTYMSGFSSKSGETFYYQCNRSGYFNSKSKGFRHLKTQGSCKINSICPAGIKVRVAENGKYLVKFTKTHVGHGQDLGHLSLSQSQREVIARKIASNIPFGTILDDVRDSIESNFSYGRIHLLTRKDLHNIKQSFNLHTNTVIQD